MNDIWDDPDMKIATDFVKFTDPGDSVTGEVLGIKIHRWEDGSTSPQLLLMVDGEEKSLTAGQYQLKAKLAELRPQAGDTLTVEFTGIQKRPGGKTLKEFDVVVTRAGARLAAPAAPAAADPLAGLTPEQRAAVEALTAAKGAAAPF